jgi:hypothetical protein
MQAIEEDNGEAALEYIKQLGLLTAAQQTAKLAGITTVTETELGYINKLLLDELARIKTTKMSEEEAAAARAEAYAKYNAAIIASGGLAKANSYSETTQTELLTIAKLAALDTVAAAQTTMDILNYVTQTDIIAKIAAAQKIADDDKMARLKDYLAEASKPIFGIGGQPLAPGSGGSTAATPIAPSWAPSWAEAENMFPVMPSPTKTGFVDNSVTIVVEGSVLNGDDFSEIINDTMLENIRRGLAQYPAGFIPG